MSKLSKLTSAITDINILSPSGQYMAEILKVICDSYGYHFGFVIQIDDHGIGNMVSSFNLPEDYPEQVSKAGVPLFSSPSGEAVRMDRIVMVNNLLSDPRIAPWYDLVRKYHLKTAIWVRLKSKGKVLGTYMLYDNKERDVSEEETDMLEQIAIVISTALVSNQYLNQLSHKTEELQQEISKRNQAEIELKKNEKRYKDISHSMADWIWEVDKNGKYVYVSTLYQH